MKGYIKTSTFFLVLAICLFGACIYACDCQCNEPNCLEDPKDYLYLGVKQHKTHGYVDEHGYEHTGYVYENVYKIRGHYYSISNDSSVHLGDCQTCKDERDAALHQLIGDMHEYIDARMDALLDTLLKVQATDTKQIKALVQKGVRDIKKEMIDYD